MVIKYRYFGAIKAFLFNHPADFTPVYTSEFVAFQKLIPEFEKLGVEITFPLAAANDAIAMTLGMLHSGKGTNTVRAVYIVDPNGIIRLILYYPQEIGRFMPEVLRAVKALQISDKNHVSMPANWPNNELIGDHVIIPPPKTVAEAADRLQHYEGFDWWFCHKSL
ncbi:MAG TPA: peroxiredoxin [Rectinema sp.]|jgi:peroxiredoxin (alkyl hydroperoxide reductase subunit C)|nr:peroxiredoxin [Rectinema sp.]